MTAIPDHYAALGIDPTADPEVIAAAYRALAKKYHPDTGATTGTASAERFSEIQQAYEVLGSPETRRQYDAELLEATQHELDEHLARKQRKIASATAAPQPPLPDLGGIRPERRSGKRAGWNPSVNLREMGPFLVVSGLLMAVAGGIASLFLSQAPLPPLEEPPLPQFPSGVEAAAPPPAPAAQPQQQAAPPEQTPLFGTSMLDEPAATLAPPPEEQDAPQPQPASAPVPVPKSKPREALAVEPRSVQAEASGPRFTVVIHEKYRSGNTIRERANVVFASETRCAEFGERAVLRRLAPFEGQRQRPRIWYECQQAP